MIETADRIFVNTKIYSLDNRNSTYEALAVKAGKILFLGDTEEALKWKGNGTEVLDFRGSVLLPSFADSHVHAPGLAYDILFNVNLYSALSAAETLDMIRSFVESNPHLEIYYGRGFNHGFFGGKESVKGPKKEHLDEISPDKPIILSDFGGNLLWMNSAAFRKYEITPKTACPPDGSIELDEETGVLWGTLKEGARCLVPYQTFTEEQNYQAAKLFQQEMLACGYGSVFALRPPGTVEPRTTAFTLFQALEKNGELHLHIQGARDMDYGGDIDAQLKEMTAVREQVQSDLIEFTTAKFFLDGVIESATGYLLAPYEKMEEKPADYRGVLVWEEEKLAYAFQRCMEEGFQIHCHSIGDGATHTALSAFEKAFAKMEVGEKDRGKYRNALTHLQLVSEEDIARMAKLQVIAVTQPYWHYKSPTAWWSLEKPLIGDRAEEEYPLGSFLRAGVTVVSSSDYPVTPQPYPFLAVQAGVTRNLVRASDFRLEEIENIDAPEYLLGKEERISVYEMLKSFTWSAAFARYAEEREGSLEVGKEANLIVLDRDPFHIDPLKLSETVILETVFRGATVYRFK